jgi:ubiquinone biosynthesis protein COQ9
MTETYDHGSTPDSTYDRDADRERLLHAALAHVAFDGWSEASLKAAARDLGIPIERALNAFPGGATELVAFHSEMADRDMLAALGREPLSEMRVRDKAALAIRLRLEANIRHREAIRSGLTYLMLPQNAALAAKLLYRTVDAIWYAIGDRSTDFNFYTKRGLLAAVYSATLFYWLGDKSEGCSATWSFLDRRIDEVMRVPKALGKLGKLTGKLPLPRRPFKRRTRTSGARG